MVCGLYKARTFLNLGLLRFALQEDLQFALFAVREAVDVFCVDLQFAVVHG